MGGFCRYLLAFEDFHRKVGDTHMFEGGRGRPGRPSVSRNVLPPKERDLGTAQPSTSDSKVNSLI